MGYFLGRWRSADGRLRSGSNTCCVEATERNHGQRRCETLRSEDLHRSEAHRSETPRTEIPGGPCRAGLPNSRPLGSADAQPLYWDRGARPHPPQRPTPLRHGPTGPRHPAGRLGRMQRLPLFGHRALRLFPHPPQRHRRQRLRRPPGLAPKRTVANRLPPRPLPACLCQRLPGRNRRTGVLFRSASRRNSRRIHRV